MSNRELTITIENPVQLEHLEALFNNEILALRVQNFLLPDKCMRIIRNINDYRNQIVSYLNGGAGKIVYRNVKTRLNAA